MVTNDTKYSKTTNEIKSKIRHWTPSACQCTLCKSYGLFYIIKLILYDVGSLMLLF